MLNLIFQFFTPIKNSYRELEDLSFGGFTRQTTSLDSVRAWSLEQD